MAPSRSDQGPWIQERGRTKKSDSTGLKSLPLIDLPEGKNGWRLNLGELAVSIKEQRAHDGGAPGNTACEGGRVYHPCLM